MKQVLLVILSCFFSMTAFAGNVTGIVVDPVEKRGNLQLRMKLVKAFVLPKTNEQKYYVTIFHVVENPGDAAIRIIAIKADTYADASARANDVKKGKLTCKELVRDGMIEWCSEPTIFPLTNE